jgi:NAD(P)-dependent dehydrogenase (short-subunit alcohol dehydrogenase family)
MDLRLGGKRSLVTGSTAGIGFAAVTRLAEEGASVVINGRSEERVEEAVRHARERAPEAEVSGVAADLGTAEGVEELLRQVPETDIWFPELDTNHILLKFRARLGDDPQVEYEMG